MLAAIETGGTKVFCAVSERDDPHTLVDRVKIPTTTPEETLAKINVFLRKHALERGLDAIGVASFGPVDTDPESERYGWVLTSPKPGWQDIDLHEAFDGVPECPTAFVTDVSGSLLGERALGAATGLDDVCYATVGTGVGVGIMVGGRLVTGHGTPELGHMPVRRHPDDDFPGRCPYHGDCLEGLAAGPAVQARWGRPAVGAEVDMIGSYVAQLAVVATLAVAPRRIVIGGGVAKTAGLLGSARRQAAVLMGGYLGANHPIQDPDSGFIVPPGLGDMAGIQGGLALASALLEGPTGSL